MLKLVNHDRGQEWWGDQKSEHDWERKQTMSVGKSDEKARRMDMIERKQTMSVGKGDEETRRVDKT